MTKITKKNRFREAVRRLGVWYRWVKARREWNDLTGEWNQ